MTTKRLIHCPDCNEDLDEDLFSDNAATKTGKSFYCKVHAAARQREWKHRNSDKVKRWKKEYRARKAQQT